VPIALLVAASVDASFLRRIEADPRFAVTLRDCRDEEVLVAAVSECEVLVTRHYNTVSRRVLERAPRLRLIAQGTSGIDNIDVDAARERGVSIVHLPGENANAVAELVIGQMIALTRTIPSYDAELRSGIWQRDDCHLRHELRHHPLGIIGLGRVGRLVARYARTFGMPVSAFDPYLANADFGERGARRVDSLETLLRESSIVSLHVPLTPETRGMLGARELALLPPGAFVINASRGEVLDLAAALARLEQRLLGGLALDVYDPEPPAIAWPDDPRLILTPHIAGCSHEAKSAIGERLYERVGEWAERRNADASGARTPE
jgi:D-3-phosphoglycerate dehydrogenase